MTAYVFRLHDGPDIPPREENVEARSDEEAHDLAELRIRFLAHLPLSMSAEPGNMFFQSASVSCSQKPEHTWA